MKPFSQACENNKVPILDVIRNYFSHARHLLEIGSGTGQHAVFFAAQLPELTWQTSDLAENHAGIMAWIHEAGLRNVSAPLLLDVTSRRWPIAETDGVFSANTAHIMDWPAVRSMFTGVGKVLRPGGYFCLYGPFNFNGQYTSDSNEAFDRMLRERDPDSGLRDFTDLQSQAAHHGMQLVNRHPMPANNFLLVWQKTNG